MCKELEIVDLASNPETATAWALCLTDTVEAFASGSVVTVAEEGVWRTPVSFCYFPFNGVSKIRMSGV